MFEQCLYFNTTSLARQLEREWTKAFKPYGLTPSQAFMLRMILEQAPLLHSDLAQALNLSRPTVSRTLDGLEKLALIQRLPTNIDGREWALQPTAAAIALKDPINAASAEVTKRLKKILGAKEFGDMVKSVRHINASLK